MKMKINSTKKDNLLPWPDNKCATNYKKEIAKELIKCLFRRWISSSSDITCPPHQQDIYEKQVGYKEERTVGV